MVAVVTPYDYGIPVGDAAAWGRVLATLGFEPVDDPGPAPAGRAAPLVILQHPQSGQRIRLYQRVGAAPPGPAEGAVTIGIPVAGAPADVLDAIRTAAPSLSVRDVEEMPKEKGIAVVLDGQRLILTSKSEPFTVVHYSADAWPNVLEFYEDVLGFCFFPLPDRGAAVRTRVENALGRVDLEASPATPPRSGSDVGHFRLVNAKLDQAEERMSGTDRGRWVAPPEGGQAWVEGPAGELMELLARLTDQE